VWSPKVSTVKPLHPWVLHLWILLNWVKNILNNNFVWTEHVHMFGHSFLINVWQNYFHSICSIMVQ
jgi:hypothetical protein